MPVLAAILFFVAESGLAPIHEAVTVTDTSVESIGIRSSYSVLLLDVSSVHWSRYAVGENPYLINFQHRLEPGDVLDVEATPITRRWTRFTVRRTGEVFGMSIIPDDGNVGRGLGFTLVVICLFFMFYSGWRDGPLSKEDFRLWIPLELLGLGLSLAGILSLPLDLGASEWALFVLASVGLAVVARRVLR